MPMLIFDTFGGSHMDERAIGKKLNEGKTKIIWEAEYDKSLVIIESKDDITAGDGTKHDVIEGKAKLATHTTCNVFRLLAKCSVPLAFREQLDDTRFVATKCDMIPYEVVVRREAHGSYLKRHPYLKKGHVFPKLILEFFLKTKDRAWNGAEIPKDDPLVVFIDDTALLFRPDMPLFGQTPFVTLSDAPLLQERNVLARMGQIAKETFLILEKAWHIQGCILADFKVEFGLTENGTLLLADVIDNDSWRVIENGEYIDKQTYRDGAPLNHVTKKFERVRDLTSEFRVPKQRIILWRASTSDDTQEFEKAFEPWRNLGCDMRVVTHSAHREPVQTYEKLALLAQKIPDSVIISYVGKSNGLGPTLAANTLIPVITVPANIQGFPQDIWSSLRTPNESPVLTVIDSRNAILAALQILAIRNPRLYAKLRLKLEERLMNVVELQ